jgi:hypothetical protein
MNTKRCSEEAIKQFLEEVHSQTNQKDLSKESNSHLEKVGDVDC